MNNKIWKLLLAAALAAVIVMVTGATYDNRQITVVSADAAAISGNADSRHPSITADGRTVVFRSDASNLVPGDTNGAMDVFVKHTDTGAIMRVSTAADGSEGDAGSDDPSISKDGGFVAFASYASNLATGATGGVSNILVKDLRDGTIKLASADADGIEGDGDSHDPVMSADGRFVAFASEATDLIPDDTNDELDIYVKDMETGYILRASSDPAWRGGNNPSGFVYGPSISADGMKVTFSSSASNLVPDADGTEDIYVKDIDTGEIVLASTNDRGVKGNGNSLMPSISADGTRVAFRSQSTNLSAADADAAPDVYQKDLATGVLTLCTINGSGDKANQPGWDPSISPDGQSVAFSSESTNLVPGIPAPIYNVYLKDIRDGSLALVSSDPLGVPANEASVSPVLSDDGSRVAFESLASNLATVDQNRHYNVFLSTFLTKESPAGC